MKHQTHAVEYKRNQAVAPMISLSCKDSEVFDAWAVICYSGLGFSSLLGFFYIPAKKHQEFHIQRNPHCELKWQNTEHNGWLAMYQLRPKMVDNYM